MPNNLMEHFTPRARRVLALAQEYAEGLQHSYIATEHIIVGLMREQTGGAGRVLRGLGLEPKRVEEVVEIVNHPLIKKSQFTTQLAPSTEHLIELSIKEARRIAKVRGLPHYAVDTEHLLLALVMQSEGVALEVFNRLGIRPKAILEETQRLIQESLSRPDPLGQMRVKTQPRAKRLPPDIYEMLRDVLVKILDMIAVGSLPAAQGIELFNALTPDLTLAPIQQAQLIRQLFQQKKIDEYYVRLTEVDPTGVEKSSATSVPLTTVLNEIDRFLAATLDTPDKPLIYQIGDGKLEVRIEKGASKNV